MRRTAIAAVAVAALFTVVGCSTSTSAPSTLPSEPATESPTASPSPSRTLTDVLPPVEIDGSKTEVDATVGQTLDVVSPGVKEVTTDDPEVLQVSQPRTDGSAEFNAGAEVVGAGTAKLTVSGSAGELYTVTVTATE